jgi:hypothetical protein
MNERLKRKKIFYVPGMISLIFIPLFCLGYFCFTDAFKINAGIDFSVVDDQNFLENKVYSRRQYKIFNFNETEFENEIKLKKMRLYLRSLVEKKDTVYGVLVHFGLQTKYKAFIGVLDILATEKAPIYVLYKDDFYVWGSKDKPSKIKKNADEQMKTCIVVEEDLSEEKTHPFSSIYDMDDELRRKKKEEEREHLLNLYKKNWIIFPAYFGLVLLNILVLVKFNKTR